MLVRFDHIANIIENADHGFESRFQLVNHALPRELNRNFKCRYASWPETPLPESA